MDNISGDQPAQPKQQSEKSDSSKFSEEEEYHSNPIFKWVVIAIIIIILFFLIRSCFPHKPKTSQRPLISVISGKVQTKDVPVFLSGLGTVTPLDSVTVKTQVDGLLMNVFFKEGQMVKKGDLLAQIDERPLQAQLTQFEGQLARDQALLANARIDLKRYEQLFKEDSVSQQTLETQRWLVKQYEGNVKTDLGLIQTVKVNLIYSKISSPVNGRVGLRLVDPGNFVQTTDTTGLFVLNTLQPITVIFILPEDNIPQVMKQINAGHELAAEAYNRSQTTHLATGKLFAVDNQIDTTTGTVKLRAQFSNQDNMLFPNQFVNIRLLVDTLPQAMVVPTAAIIKGAKGSFVYQLKEDNTVKMTPVTVGIVEGNNTVIKEGVKPGQTIVVQGTDKLTDGAKVKVWEGNRAVRENKT